MALDKSIKTQGLTKKFNRNKEIVQGVNLIVNKGELFCLVGPNGAGKTTLIKMLCGLILPTNGEIAIDGSVGLVTGVERSFYWRLTGRENMEFFAALYGLSPQAGKKRIEELFGILRIDEPNKRFQECASGVKQKLSIARALLSDPSLLFIDEFTKSFDPASARELRRLIKETLVREHGKPVVMGESLGGYVCHCERAEGERSNLSDGDRDCFVAHSVRFSQ